MRQTGRGAVLAVHGDGDGYNALIASELAGSAFFDFEYE
jgi:hypothetical protein